MGKSFKQIFNKKKTYEYYKSMTQLYALVDYGDGKVLDTDKSRPSRYIFCKIDAEGECRNLSGEKYSVVYKNQSENGVSFDAEKKSEGSADYIVDENGNMYAPIYLKRSENELLGLTDTKLTCRKEDYKNSVVKNLSYALQNIHIERNDGEHDADKVWVVFENADLMDGGDIEYYAGLDDSTIVNSAMLNQVTNSLNRLNSACLYTHVLDLYRQQHPKADKQSKHTKKYNKSSGGLSSESEEPSAENDYNIEL